jgi:hypothetical protein
MFLPYSTENTSTMLGRVAGFCTMVSVTLILISNRNVSFCTYVVSTTGPERGI